jgi:hypothetical protein
MKECRKSGKKEEEENKIKNNAYIGLWLIKVPPCEALKPPLSS